MLNVVYSRKSTQKEIQMLKYREKKETGDMLYSVGLMEG